MEQRGVSKDKVCLLDPKSPYAVSITDAGNFTSSTKDAAAGGPFEFFLYGGILGDDPPRDRTSSLRQLGFPSRHLGGVQMTTDTALGVTKRCVEDAYLLNLDDTKEQEEKWGDNKQTEKKLEWVNYPELNFGKGESVEMPFRYMVDETKPVVGNAGGKKPLMPEGMRELIKKDLGRSFEF